MTLGPTTRTPPVRPLTEALVPSVDRLLILQLLPRSPLYRGLTVGILAAIPIVSSLLQFLATSPPGSRPDLWPLATVQGITVSLLLGLYGIWWALERISADINALMKLEQERHSVADRVRSYYGPTHAQLVWALACAISSSTAVVVASLPNDLDVGMTIAVFELTFFAPNSLYWAVRLSQFTRLVASSTLRFRGRDPRSEYAVSRLGLVVAGALGLVGLEMFLTGLTIWQFTDRLPESAHPTWRWVVMMILQVVVLAAMVFVALLFVAAIARLRATVRTEKARRVKELQDAIDSLSGSGLGHHARRNRRVRWNRELHELRTPRSGVVDRWFQFAMVAITVPIGVILQVILVMLGIVRP